MSQINSMRGIVVPSAVPQRVQPRKDREQQRRQQEARDHAQEESKAPADDDTSHLDLKA